MTRRSFFAALAGLPLIGKLVKKPAPRLAFDPDAFPMVFLSQDISLADYKAQFPSRYDVLYGYAKYEPEIIVSGDKVYRLMKNTKRYEPIL